MILKLKKIFGILTILLFLIPMSVNAESLNNCQIAVNLNVPENFDLPCFAVFYNIDTEVEYRVNLLKENDYRGRVSVTEGTYLIAQISVVDDITCKYPFELPSEPVTLTEKNNITIASKLLNYDEVEGAIKDYIAESNAEVSEEVEEPDENTEEVIEPDVEPEEEKEIPLLAKILVVIIVIVLFIFIIFIVYKAFFEVEKK